VEALIGRQSCDFNFADTAPDRSIGFTSKASSHPRQATSQSIPST